MATLSHAEPTAKFSIPMVDDALDIEIGIFDPGSDEVADRLAWLNDSSMNDPASYPGPGWDVPIGPIPSTAKDCREWGRDHAFAGVEPDHPFGLANDLWMAIWRGYRDGLVEVAHQEEIDRALATSFRTDAEIGRGFDSLPTPGELAEELGRIDFESLLGEGPVADFVRDAIAAHAKDVVLFGARTWQELEARDNVMSASFGEKGGAL